jgi:death-on-curing protein
VKFLTAQAGVVIHDSVICSNELPGVTPHRSIEAVIARVENRMAYGLIGDVFDLAACYAAYITVAHAFNLKTSVDCVQTA